MNSPKEVDGGFVVACSDGAVLLQPSKEVLNQMAGLIQMPVIVALHSWRRLVCRLFGNPTTMLKNQKPPAKSEQQDRHAVRNRHSSLAAKRAKEARSQRDGHAKDGVGE